LRLWSQEFAQDCCIDSRLRGIRVYYYLKGVCLRIEEYTSTKSRLSGAHGGLDLIIPLNRAFEYLTVSSCAIRIAWIASSRDILISCAQLKDTALSTRSRSVLLFERDKGTRLNALSQINFCNHFWQLKREEDEALPMCIQCHRWGSARIAE